MRVLAVAAVLFAAAGCLDVDSGDGVLQCSTVPQRPCPQGFYCLQPGNTCWRYGHFPSDMADPIAVFPPGSGDQSDFSVPVEQDMSVPSTDDMLPNDDLSSMD